MTSGFRSGIKGTFAIYSDDSDRMMPLSSSLSNNEYHHPSPLPIEAPVDNGIPSNTDPLVLVVQLKKELDDERRRFDRERNELEAALSAARGATREEVQALRESVAAAEAKAKRAGEEAEAERAKRREAEADWNVERRNLRDELERAKASHEAKEEDLQDRLQGELSAADTKAAAAVESLRQEHAARRAREAVAEKKFAALQVQLTAAEEAREALQRSAVADAKQFRMELDEACMRHSEACQQLVDLDHKRAQLVEENRQLAAELEAALVAGEEQRRHLEAELLHVQEEAAEGAEVARREHRAEMKALESDFRSRLDEAKQRLAAILRQKKTKYAEQRANLEDKLKKCQAQLKAEKSDGAEVRARLARLLGRASGLIEDHCTTTRRLITDGRDSTASIFSASARDDASLLSEAWSLPTAVEIEPFAPRD